MEQKSGKFSIRALAECKLFMPGLGKISETRVFVD